MNDTTPPRDTQESIPVILPEVLWDGIRIAWHRLQWLTKDTLILHAEREQMKRGAWDRLHHGEHTPEAVADLLIAWAHTDFSSIKLRPTYARLEEYAGGIVETLSQVAKLRAECRREVQP